MTDYQNVNIAGSMMVIMLILQFSSNGNRKSAPVIKDLLSIPKLSHGINWLEILFHLLSENLLTTVGDTTGDTKSPPHGSMSL